MNSKMTCFSMAPKCRGPLVVGGLMVPQIHSSSNKAGPQVVSLSHPSSDHSTTPSAHHHLPPHTSSHHFIVLKGLSHIVVTCRCVVRRLYFAIPWPWKARRKEKDSGSGPSSGGPGGSDEGKLYLETALLERHLNETELQRMVAIPHGFEENEWMASHTISLFEHVNLIYGTISEFCTSTSCPDMTGPCMRTYLWFDEKGKKVKVAAPQYVDYVMTFIQKTINDESIFPTKSTNAFPSSFKPIVKKICRLMFHVIAHIYHCHFKEIVLLCLHAHLNCVFAHFTIFNESFKLVDEKETEILQDLSLAMKLRSDLVVVDDDPMNSESNKENIGLSKSASGRVMFPSSTSSSEPSDSAGMHRTADTSTSSASTYISSNDDGLLIKEPALVNSTSESH